MCTMHIKSPPALRARVALCHIYYSIITIQYYILLHACFFPETINFIETTTHQHSSNVFTATKKDRLTQENSLHSTIIAFSNKLNVIFIEIVQTFSLTLCATHRYNSSHKNIILTFETVSQNRVALSQK